MHGVSVLRIPPGIDEGEEACWEQRRPRAADAVFLEALQVWGCNGAELADAAGVEIKGRAVFPVGERFSEGERGEGAAICLEEAGMVFVAENGFREAAIEVAKTGAIPVPGVAEHKGDVFDGDVHCLGGEDGFGGRGDGALDFVAGEACAGGFEGVDSGGGRVGHSREDG